MYRLTVPNIDPKVFHSYWYGAGELVSVNEGSVPGTKTFVVEYHADHEFYARYQSERFASGLYFAEIEEIGV